MSFNSSSGSSSINGAVATGLPIPSATQEIITETFTTNSSYTNVYTVPNVTGNEKFLLIGFLAPCTANCYFDITGVGMFKILANTSGAFSSPYPIKVYTAGQSVNIKGTNNYLSAIWGVLIDE